MTGYISKTHSTCKLYVSLLIRRPREAVFKQLAEITFLWKTIFQFMNRRVSKNTKFKREEKYWSILGEKALSNERIWK